MKAEIKKVLIAFRNDCIVNKGAVMTTPYLERIMNIIREGKHD